MSFWKELKQGFGETADRLLSAAEARTPNLDEFKPREYHSSEKHPNALKQGDSIVAVEYSQGSRSSDNALSVEGVVFSVDKRNELVILLTENGQEFVKFSEAQFFSKEDMDSGKLRNDEKMNREDMKDGVIYDAEIIDD